MSRGAEAVAAAPRVLGHVDRFSAFRQAAYLTGWCFSTAAPIDMLEIRPAGFPQSAPLRRFTPEFRPSPDVAAAHGPAAACCRFDAVVPLGAAASMVCGGSLAAVLAGGAVSPLCALGTFRPSAASDLSEEFFARLAALPRPRVLEIGARARSGITRRDRMPPGSRYTGVDIVAGENVDVVCDAHALAAALPAESFDAVFAISVLEHLLMPWKFVIELNTVLASGAIGLFATHQCWPVHDAPWDYWRFSDGAWRGLLNPATGFEIVATAMGEPAHIVAADCHGATNFGPEATGYLASNVMFRKIGRTALSWNVDPALLVHAPYPA